MTKKIGIIGSGMVGKALATGLTKHGYEVMIGSREPEKITEWEGKKGTFSETAAQADIILLAVKGAVAQDALMLCGAENLKGKTVIDVTNPIADLPPENGVLRFFTNLDESLMERLQKTMPEVHFVKAFNSVGNAHMIDPNFDEKPTMFICGNNEEAKKEVSALLVEVGWEAEDMGGAQAARAIEPLCMLWCIPGLLKNQWTHAFKLLKMKA